MTRAIGAEAHAGPPCRRTRFESGISHRGKQTMPLRGGGRRRPVDGGESLPASGPTEKQGSAKSDAAPPGTRKLTATGPGFPIVSPEVA